MRWTNLCQILLNQLKIKERKRLTNTLVSLQKVMPIIKRANQTNFTVISNDIINNEILSLEAKAILAYLLSKPESWEIQFSDVETYGKIGREKREKIFRELENAGYFERVENRRSGKFGFNYLVHESPINIARKPSTVKPSTVKPSTVKPSTVKPPLSKDLKKVNTEEEANALLPPSDTALLSENERIGKALKFLEAEGVRITDRAAQVKSLRALFKSGYQSTQIVECFRALKKESLASNRIWRVSFTTVNQQIATFLEKQKSPSGNVNLRWENPNMPMKQDPNRKYNPTGVVI